MKEINIRWLTYKEELALSLFFSNVEKFKCLSSMPNFQVELLTEPMILYNKETASLATILSCFKILYAIPGHEVLQSKNDEIIHIIQERFGFEISDEVDLCKYNPNGPGDILGKSDYPKFLFWVLSCRNNGYGHGKESWDTLKWKYKFVLTDALREQHLKTLERGMTVDQIEQTRRLVEEDKNKKDAGVRDNTKPLPEKARRFLEMIDEPGAVLAFFDEGKTYYSYTGIYYTGIYESFIRYVFSNTKHITLRVGGYSYRVESGVLSISQLLRADQRRIECLDCQPDCLVENEKSVGPRYHLMSKYVFNYEDEFVKYAEEYDYKYFALGGMERPMVYYYVNNIDTGWYSEDGQFKNFYSKERGLQALSDVAMIRGYKDIKPATAAVFTDSKLGAGTEILFGPAAHFDKQDRASSQRKLFEDARIPYLNLGDL